MDIFRYLEKHPKDIDIAVKKNWNWMELFKEMLFRQFPFRWNILLQNMGRRCSQFLDAMCEWGYNNTDGRYVMTHPTCEDE